MENNHNYVRFEIGNYNFVYFVLIYKIICNNKLINHNTFPKNHHFSATKKVY